MSRCFPFPPPEYVWKGVSGPALVELMSKEEKRAKKQKKEIEGKRAKKERKRAKKEKKEIDKLMKEFRAGGEEKRYKGGDCDPSSLLNNKDEEDGTGSALLLSKTFESGILESLYKTLLENLVVPLQQIDDDYISDQEWLFTTNKKQDDDGQQVSKRLKATSYGLNQLTYALPYVIPY